MTPPTPEPTPLAVTQAAAGDLIVRHLAKIVIGLGAVIALVWQMSGDAAEFKGRITAVEKDIVELKVDVEQLRIREGSK